MGLYLFQDCAQAFRLIAENGINNQIYNIASGNIRYLYEFIDSLHKIVNPQSKINIGSIPYYEHQSMNLTADITPLMECGFKPKFTFEEGIKDMLNNF